jgi:hypothetical protein
MVPPAGEVRPGRARCLYALLDGRPAGIFVHGLEDLSIQRPELSLDARKEARAVCHGLSAHHKSPLRLSAADLVGAIAQGLDAHMQPPGMTHGPKRA